jgi:hypothetical protein
MEEIEALAEDLRLVGGLDAEPLARMDAPEPPLEPGLDFRVHRAPASNTAPIAATYTSEQVVR